MFVKIYKYIKENKLNVCCWFVLLLVFLLCLQGLNPCITKRPKHFFAILEINCYLNKYALLNEGYLPDSKTIESTIRMMENNNRINLKKISVHAVQYSNPPHNYDNFKVILWAEKDGKLLFIIYVYNGECRGLLA